MNDLAPDTSTVLDAEPLGGPSGGGEPKAPTLQETITTAMKEAPKEESAEPAESDDKAESKEKPEKGAEKPEEGKEAPEAKEGRKPAERAPDGKFAAKQSEGDDANPAGTETKVEETSPQAKQVAQGIEVAPAKFLPDAKERWANTPRPVQRDVENMIREHEAELTKHRESVERYEPLRQFDDLVRQNGRAGLHETLAEVAQLEDLMAANPLAALNQILMRAGPRKADGQPISFFELAQAVVNSGPDTYQKMVAQPAQQHNGQQANPEVEQLKEQMARMQEQTLNATVIEPFKREHPRYEELQGDIAFFLKSDKIPRTLSPSDRLAAAYDMAERINPPSSAAPQNKTDLEPGDRAAPDFSGSKSIKSAPGAVSPDLEPDRGGSIGEILRAEMRRAKVS